MKIKYLIAALAAYSISSTAIATQNNDIELYGRAGLPGFGVGVGYGINEKVSVRADYNTLGTIKRNFKKNSLDFNAKLKNDKINLAVDLFPLENGFRLTTGLGLLQTQVKGDGHIRVSGQQSFKIGNKRYHVDLDATDTAQATVKYPSVSPYFGVGFGHNIKQKKGGEWGFLFDLGFYVGKPKTSMHISDGLRQKLINAAQTANAQTIEQATAEIDANIEREKNKVLSKADKFKVLPVISFGVSYRF